MWVTADTLITMAALLSAATAICTAVYKLVKWLQAQNYQSEQIKELQEEQCLIVYAQLACLNGLNQLGCNGEVTKALDKVNKHINQKAHHIE